MNPLVFVANAAWAAASLPAYVRFARALRDPAAAQRDVLRRLIARNADSAFGRAHRFDEICDHRAFAARVPLNDYDALQSWVARIRRGERRVLTSEPVTNLVPTSGSTGARKLIPFTAGLQREFNAAIGPWIVDLFRRDPKLLDGSAYWSISPLVRDNVREESAVPIGFDDDAAYLGGVRRRLVDAIMAAPSSLRQLREVSVFRRATLVALLRRPDLRLISVWHPSFLTLLLDELVASWDELRSEVRDSRRRAADPCEVRSIWPNLRLVSCWCDAHAELAARDLARRLPGVRIQSKGLLATEAVVTLPFAEKHPLAVTSHFYEFRSDTGEVLLAHELRDGETYEVVVTTAGGLWRYRLGDRVVVNGFLARTPSLRFVGRVGGVSDRRGEKLAEPFVAGVIRDLFAGREPPRFSLLAPEELANGRCHYALFVEGHSRPDDSVRLDAALRANPHYAWCRDLGQLEAPVVVRIDSSGYDIYLRRAAARGLRAGDVKPAALSCESGWSAHFRRPSGPEECQLLVDTNSGRPGGAVAEVR